MNKKGIFITIEGNEGAGKSTILTLLGKTLKSRGIKFLLTREPGGTKCKIAEQIRQIILDVKNTEMSRITEAYLYAASRAQHLEQVVRPALQDGDLVICDRFIDSSLAYQGYSRGLGIDQVWELNKLAMDGDCVPELTLLFLVDPEVGIERINKNADREINRLDNEAMKFHHEVYKGYLQVAKKYKNRVVIIDANQPVEKVLVDVIDVLEGRIGI